MPFPHHIRQHQFTYRIRKEWGQLYWFNFGVPSSGQRTFAEQHPALIINNLGITLPGTVLIIPVTGVEHRRPGYEFHVEISKLECPELDKDSVAKVDQIYCVEVREMPDQYFICKLETDTMRRIYAKLLKVLNFDKFLK